MRVLGLLLLMLCGYYLRFYIVQGDPSTLVQLSSLLGGSALLLAPTRGRAWLAVLLLGFVLSAVFVPATDRDSHSVSDTLNRVAPTLGLWLALGLRLRAERAG